MEVGYTNPHISGRVFRAPKVIKTYWSRVKARGGFWIATEQNEQDPSTEPTSHGWESQPRALPSKWPERPVNSSLPFFESLPCLLPNLKSARPWLTGQLQHSEACECCCRPKFYRNEMEVCTGRNTVLDKI